MLDTGPKLLNLVTFMFGTVSRLVADSNVKFALPSNAPFPLYCILLLGPYGFPPALKGLPLA